jgi:hypothetical protein
MSEFFKQNAQNDDKKKEDKFSMGGLIVFSD